MIPVIIPKVSFSESLDISKYINGLISNSVMDDIRVSFKQAVSKTDINIPNYIFTTIINSILQNFYTPDIGIALLKQEYTAFEITNIFDWSVDQLALLKIFNGNTEKSGNDYIKYPSICNLDESIVKDAYILYLLDNLNREYACAYINEVNTMNDYCSTMNDHIPDNHYDEYLYIRTIIYKILSGTYTVE